MTSMLRGWRFAVPLAATLAVALAGCRRGDPARTKAGAGAVAGQAGTAPIPLDRIEAAEAARDETAIAAEALTTRDVGTRRAAARALARIADEGASERLEKTLADEDPEVVSWSAYGLGFACRGREDETVRRLLTRAVTLPPARQPAGAAFELTPRNTVAAALARCGGMAAERTLTAWLADSGDRSRAAALGLGRLANVQHRLSDETLVALLDRASAPQPLAAALYPFSRLEALSEATTKRLYEVARAALSSGGERRTFAIRALGSAGEAGIQPLADLFGDETAPAGDRCGAAAELGRIGARAKPALGRAFAHAVRTELVLDERFILNNFAPLSAALSTTLWPSAEARDALLRLSELPVPEGASPALRRRIIALRCEGAAALAGKASKAEKLVACDPEADGHAGLVALLRVLDRGEITKARFARWKDLAESKDLAVHRAALALVPLHPEMPAIVELLASAIQAEQPGIAAQAARVLALEPRRAARAPLLEQGTGADSAPSAAAPAAAADPKIVDALAHAMDADRPPDQVEPRVAFMDAAAALGTLSLKGRIERYCKSDNATLRTRAERALAAFGESKPSCPRQRATSGPPLLDPPILAKTVTLTLLTDGGRLGLTLDPALSPRAVSRVVALAKSGFYSGIPIHRVTPGFVVQFGDPVGDGSGGAGKPPLPCETSPVEFSAFSVGVALSGRDTGSSQIFVTLSPQPHLDGDYAEIGRADPEWAGAAEGDVIQSVEVR